MKYIFKKCYQFLKTISFSFLLPLGSVLFIVGFAAVASFLTHGSRNDFVDIELEYLISFAAIALVSFPFLNRYFTFFKSVVHCFCSFVILVGCYVNFQKIVNEGGVDDSFFSFQFFALSIMMAILFCIAALSGSRGVNDVISIVHGMFRFSINPFKTTKDLKEWVRVEKENDTKKQAKELKCKFQLDSVKSKRRCL